MLSDEEKKAIERIEDFLTTNIILSISSDETANAKELTAFISKNEYLSIEFIASMFLKQSKEIEEYSIKLLSNAGIYQLGFNDGIKSVENKIKAKIEEYENKIKKIRSKKLINEPEDTIVITRYAHYISVLQSLLEKE